MPVLRWNGVEDTEAAARLVGPRLKQLRENRGLTQRQLADRVKVSKNTVLRIEQGQPISEAILEKLCDALQTILPNLLIPETEDRSNIRVHRADREEWRVAFRRKRAPKTITDFKVVDEAKERRRLGGLDFVSGFLLNHQCMLAGGKLQAAEIELYGEQEKAGFRHSGEEFVYCLRGSLKLTVGEESVILQPGDSATFWSGRRHRYESALPSNTPEPTRMLMVWFEAPEDPSSRAHDAECEGAE